METKVKDYPDKMRFPRARPLSEMAADMVQGSGLTEKEGMMILTNILGKLVDSTMQKKVSIKDDN